MPLEGLLNFANVSNHLIMIGIYIILALSLNLINGSLGAFSLGHNGFWGMGAYLAGIVVWTMGSPDGSLLAFLLSFMAGTLGAALFGLCVGIPCLRLKGDYLAIATLGFAEIFVICVRNSERWKIFGERGLGGAAGFSLGDGFRGGNDYALALTGSITGQRVFYLILTYSLVLLCFLLIRRLLNSAHGRAIEAIREDETAAELLGVNLTRYKVFTFVIAAGMAGLAGALFANYRATLAPAYFPLMEGIKILLIVVLGGLGSYSGSMLAVFVLYISEQSLLLVRTEVPFLGYSDAGFAIVQKPIKELWQVIFALILVLLMLLRPQGLMGRQEFSRTFCRSKWKDFIAQPRIYLLTAMQWLLLLAAIGYSDVFPPLILLGVALFFALQWLRKRLLQNTAPTTESSSA